MINLQNNNGFKWFHAETIWVKGAFFDENNNFFESNNLLDYFKEINSFADFVIAIKKCNGIFSVVFQHNYEFWCASDRSGTFPLFYFQQNSGWVITDNYTSIVLSNSNNFNEFQINTFRSLGHTFGCETLIANVYQMQCSQIIQLQPKGVKTSAFYHSFSVKNFNNKDAGFLFSEGIAVFENAFKRLVTSLNGRTAVVPLSGGYDSRMIVAGLKTQGYQNVICFTYGKHKNNHELAISQNVANQLGYKWIFVEYNKQLFSNFVDDPLFQEYVQYMSHLGSMFYLQEYFAVKYLHDNNMIPVDAVFLPGHSGDLLGGSQLVKVFDKTIGFNQIPELFIAKKSTLDKLSVKDANTLKQRITDAIVSLEQQHAATVFEELDIREKISKIIFNSSMVFDYFNYEKRFPFWDLELLNFFLSLPIEQREMKKLYDTILTQHYFAPLNINYTKELQPKKNQLITQSVKNKIKKYLPLKFRLALLKKADWINYYTATQPLISEMKKNRYPFKFKGKSFNEILVGYYLFSLTYKGRFQN